MTADRWTDSGKPIPYPDGQVPTRSAFDRLLDTFEEDLERAIRESPKNALGSESSSHRGHGLCVVCGVPAGDTWDGVAMCGECEGEMVDALTESTRSCVDCGEEFVPLSESARRCRHCAAVKYMS